jgi:murein DD-endopeptidase MepM/ murein hydrolase activator NlpD
MVFTRDKKKVPYIKENRMGKRKEKSYNKHVYKRANYKYYVKGDSKIERGERLAELAVKGVALAFYPFYLVYSGIKSVAGKVQAFSKNRVKASDNAGKRTITYFSKGSSVSGFLKTSREKANNFILKIAPFVKRYKWQTAAGSAMAVLLAVALITFGTMTPNANLEANATHVVTVPGQSDSESETGDAFEAVDTASVSEEAAAVVAVPEFKVLSVASVKAYQVTADGVAIANFKTEEEANQLLDELKAKYTTPEEGSEVEYVEVGFSEDVEVTKTYLDIMNFAGYDTVEDALAYVIKGTKEEKTHIVQKGENFWVIATYYGISPYDLEAANPDVKPETLQIGQEISLVVPKPLIGVRTVETASYTEQIAYDVVYEETGSLYKGETKTKVNGVYGESAIEAEIIRENGREVSRNILSEAVVSEPSSQVVYKGTKDPPPRMGTGTLIKPVSGVITSEFGSWRWGYRHTGIDIAVSVGTSVKAADGGVVTFSGYSSSYGYYIIINHGGNISTLYAHNSKLLVSAGDKVYQGQQIALSGNTGHSTGPHVHFEVRVNDVAKNPRNYVNF